MGRRRRIAAAALTAVALWPAVASADSIVFRRDGDVWLMAPDGTGQRAVTHGERRYEWPSAADDGTILAPDTTGWLHRLTSAGQPVGAPIPTAAAVATEDAPAEAATHVRISPDGTRVAYDEAIDGDVTTLWTPAGSTALAFPNQSLGQEGLVTPSWIGSGRLLLSQDLSAPRPLEPTFWLYTAGGGDNSATPWFSDPGATWATGFDAAASRAGTRVAVLEEDAAENGGTPRRVVLRLFAGATPEFRCEIALEAAETYASASPTFSPNGSQLAWAESDGIHVATLGDLDDCGAIREQVVTLPGAWEPYWSAADVPPASATPGAAKLVLALKTRARPHRLTVLKRGIAVRVTVSAPTKVRLTVRTSGRRLVSTTRTFRDAGTRTIRVRARLAKRLVVRASAVGAASAVAVVRPR